VLEGITRRTVLELCQEIGVEAELGTVPAEALHEADEVFITSTAGGVMPVTRVDDRILGNGAPGPITTRIHDLYWSKKEAGWYATPVDYSARGETPDRRQG
jgi:branched-chain amino acid aminotransferase